ncbi:MAG: AAA family ATPase [Chloroflexi bacterium]|jgi:replicative DNA helicase|nr:AAA family ATPase [Chloroflexota bacterium]
MDQRFVAAEAEQVVLGAMLNDEKAIAQAVETLDENCFYHTSHRLIYMAILRLYEISRPVDQSTVTEALRKDKQLEKAGGEEYLSVLASRGITEGVDHYVRIVWDNSIRRQAVELAQQILDQTDMEHIQMLVRWAEREFRRLAERTCRGQFVVLESALPEALEYIEQTQNWDTMSLGIGTELPKLDEIMSVPRSGNLTILAGPSGVGKTDLILLLAKHVALEEEIGVALFSPKATAIQIAQRLICIEANANLHQAQTGRLQEEDWEVLKRGSERLAQAPIYICDEPVTILEMQLMTRLLQSEYGVGIVVVDDLSLLKPHGRERSNPPEVSQIIIGLKELAKILNVPVLGVFEWRDKLDRRPRMSDLNESGYGIIEITASTVIFLHRPDTPLGGEEEAGKDTVELIIEKQRNDPLNLLWECRSISQVEIAKLSISAEDPP